MTTKSRYAHSLTLTQEDEIRLENLRKNTWTIINIFKAGLQTIEDMIKKAKDIVPEK